MFRGLRENDTTPLGSLSVRSPAPDLSRFVTVSGDQAFSPVGVRSPTFLIMSEIIAYFSDALGDRYKLERHLGEGGMATVYLGEDLKHDRKVAVKVLRPELAAVLGAERVEHGKDARRHRRRGRAHSLAATSIAKQRACRCDGAKR